MAGLPALATSSLYPQVTNTILFSYHMSLAAFHNCKHALHQAPSMQGAMPRMSEANLNAMFNSYPNYGAR